MLADAFVDGRLTREEYDDRQNTLYASRTLGEMPALVTDLVPNRDIGVQARGVLGGGHVTFDGAVFNGAPDGANADLDTNGSKDLDGRLTVRFGGLDIDPGIA